MGTMFSITLYASDQTTAYRAAEAAFARADPARQDARTQFYLAYAFYRHGWGRVYHDDALFAQGLAFDSGGALAGLLSLSAALRVVID